MKIIDITTDSIGKTITIQAWVEGIRDQKRMAFLMLRDGVGRDRHIQAIIIKPKNPDAPQNTVPQGLTTQACLIPTIESFVEVTGVVQALPAGQFSHKPFEFIVSGIKVLGASDNEFLNKCPPQSGPDVKLTERHIYIRDPKFALYTKLRAILVQALRKHFEDTDCTEIFPPSFVGNQCEGGATLFKLPYPARDTGDIDAYLTQSSQFYLEYVLPAIGDCYCIAPSFRAERSHTRRHLTEFLHAESEWKGIMCMEDHLNKLRALIKGTIQNFAQMGEAYLKELDLWDRQQQLLAMCDDIVVLTHREAIDYCLVHDIWKDAETKTPFEYTDDIPEMQERQIIDSMGKIVFLVRFPRGFKSFYMLCDPEDTEYVLGCDVEVPGVGEVVGSGVRVYDSNELAERLHEQGLKEEDYREYLDIRKYGAGRTSGMGLGVDRFLTWLLDCHSIREVVTFPRYPGKLFP